MEMDHPDVDVIARLWAVNKYPNKSA